ncbi:hypothetical protein [Mesorhizobium sp.]|uniref:hypothetical protein n=1 Tax=Mesorhizobium sp. TaxID=1871066 RepID=UPI0025D01883|nr:hypothetical protein [Mesorhizobium sp.]
MLKDEVQILWNAYAKAYSLGDAAICGTMFTADADTHLTRLPAIGRDAIEALHTVWTQGHGEGAEKKMSLLQAGRSGDLAWCLAIRRD